jgi:pimeloyl-ACP methyl ester carboxylesterase
VEGVVFIAPASLNLDGRTDDPFTQALLQFRLELGLDEGWDRFNRRSWDRDFPGFVRWFVETASPEPGAEELRRLAIGWGLQLRPEELAATIEGRLTTPPSEAAARLRALAPAVVCPRLVVQGELDAIAPRHRAETLATVLAAALVVVDGAGHFLQASRPDVVNPLLERFLAEVSGGAVG